ncbi:MAG: MarR family winged helix-turn-helix transcriptional regulator [Bacillota bacterium]
MFTYDDYFDLIFDNIKRIAFPEEWLTIDIEMSKQEIFTIMMADRLGEATMSQISDQMNFPMSTATGIIDRLVKKGYILRGRSETDRRIVTITLTDKGKMFAEDLKTNISDYVKLVYDSLDEEERQYLFRIINKLSNAFGQLVTNGQKDMDKQNSIKRIEIE